jgi:predicted DNA-binding transcriptional regulator YafY
MAEDGGVSRPQRLLALLIALQTGRTRTASELAERLGVSPRTVLRDVAALAAADVPIRADRGRFGGIVLERALDLDLGRLTLAETEVLLVAGIDATRARTLGLEDQAGAAADKLAARRRRPGTRPDARSLPLDEVVTIDGAAWFGAPGTPDAAVLLRDVRLGRRLRVRYRASGRSQPRERDVDPYGLSERGGRWYLIADADGSPRMYALERLESWLVLDDERRIRRGATLAGTAADLAAVLEGAQRTIVTAVLAADRVDLARRILGSRLRSVEPLDASSARIAVGYESVDGVRQLLQFGDHIEIVDPPEARALVLGLARALARRHDR